MRRVTTPPGVRALRARAERAAGAGLARAGRGGAFARSSASISFEQMGHLAVRRLWRQKSEVMARRGR